MQQSIILASSSPRRRELLSQCGIKFEIIVSNIDEAKVPNEKPQELVQRLALGKAQAVAKNHSNAWVIGADTTVFIDDKILEKPLTPQDAFEMLSLIAGRTHSVYSAFAIVNHGRHFNYCELHHTKVTMMDLSPEEIRAYVESGDPMDKAGAYGIQGRGSALVTKVEGSYTNVVGLPIAELVTALKKHGIIQSRINI